MIVTQNIECRGPINYDIYNFTSHQIEDHTNTKSFLILNNLLYFCHVCIQKAVQQSLPCKNSLLFFY